MPSDSSLMRNAETERMPRSAITTRARHLSRRGLVEVCAIGIDPHKSIGQYSIVLHFMKYSFIRCLTVALASTKLRFDERQMVFSVSHGSESSDMTTVLNIQ